jgi:hypothetical protein
VPTYQPLGQSQDDVQHESCHSTYRQRTMPRPHHVKGLNRGSLSITPASGFPGGHPVAQALLEALLSMSLCWT